VGLLGVRLALFLAHKGAGSYQAGVAGAGFGDPALLLANLLMHLQAALTNFQASGALTFHWKTAAALAALVLTLAAVAAWRAGKGDAPRAGAYLTRSEEHTS